MAPGVETTGPGCGDRVALVTGASRGIGAAIAARLAQAGHPVVVNYASSALAAAEVVSQIERQGGRAEAIRADVSDPDQVIEMFSRANDVLGPPLILVNNAGVSHAVSARRMTVDEWDRAIAVNLSGAFYCLNAALPAMYDHAWGRVVMIGSPSGGRSMSPGLSAYAAAKAGLVAMGRAVALEVQRRGITVNTVAPGFVQSDMTEGHGDDVMAAMEQTWPAVPPDAIGDLVAFLVSEGAAHVSGEDIAVWRGGPIHLPQTRPG